MKPKYLLSFALLLTGTVIFTYATTRTWTTQYVLERAGQHVNLDRRYQVLVRMGRRTPRFFGRV